MIAIMGLFMLGIIFSSIAGGLYWYFTQEDEETTTATTATTATTTAPPTTTPQPGCYIKFSDCANATNKQNYIDTVGPLNEFVLASEWGLTNNSNNPSYRSKEACDAYLQTIHNWCQNTTQTKENKFVPMPSEVFDLTDEQAQCYKDRYSELSSQTLAEVKETWKNEGFSGQAYPFCRPTYS